MKALLLETTAGRLRGVAQALRARGHEVDVQLVDAAASRRLEELAAAPALVVVDLEPLDGPSLELCRQLRALPGGAAAVALGYGCHDADELRPALAAGLDDCLHASADAEQLAFRLAVAEELAERRELERTSLARLRQLEKAVETMQLGVTICDPERRILYVNPADAAMHGWDVEELLGRDVRVFAVPDSHRDLSRQRLASLARWKRESTNVRKDGTVFPVQITSDVVTDRRGRPVALVTCCEDISDRKAADEARRESEERYALAARGSHDGLWDWDLRRDLVHFSARWREILGDDGGGLTGGPAEWFDRVHPADLEPLRKALDRHLAGESPHFEASHRIVHADGNFRWVLARGLAVRDEKGTPTRIAGSLTDLTGKGAHDQLTGLPNRAFFIERVAGAVERWKRSPQQLCAILVVDLDRFKIVNESLGHVAGDELLTALAQRLEGGLRSSDTLGRLDGTLSRAGGDEFVILLEGIRDADDAIRVAERVHAALETPFVVQGHEVFTTASVGIAVVRPGCERAEDLLRDADSALHRAKLLGDSRFQLFDEGMHERAVQRLRTESDLRRALDRGELCTRYQPIVELATGTIVGFEALVRWQHPEKGLLGPDSFIPVAEESDLILAIDRWMLSTVCGEMRRLRDETARDGLAVSVNLSGKHFSQSHLVVAVREALAAAGLEGAALKLEVTEGVLMQSPELTRSLMAELDALGVQVCLDDFGTGYSSLSYLHEFPLHILKVDRSFVGRLGQRDGKIVETIVNLAFHLGMAVVAEGVETAEQLAQLLELGCELGQGFYFARPAPFEELGELLRSGPTPPPA